jgi:hypothetical protein
MRKGRPRSPEMSTPETNVPSSEASSVELGHKIRRRRDVLRLEVLGDRGAPLANGLSVTTSELVEPAPELSVEAVEVWQLFDQATPLVRAAMLQLVCSAVIKRGE